MAIKTNKTINMNAIAELRRGAFTANEQKSFSEMLINEIIDGNANVLEVELRLKSMEKIIENVRKNATVKQLLISEAEKYGSKTFDAYGATITITGKQSYDYKSCGSEKYNSLISEIEKLTAQTKEMEAQFKTIKEPISTMEGEIINPPKINKTEFLTIKF